MIEQMQGYLIIIISAFFSLVFLGISALVEAHRERLSWLLKKISWKTTRKFFYLWVGILALRKLLYYISFNGVIQTPTSVWWVDKKELISIYAVFVALLFFLFGLGLMARSFALRSNGESDLVYNLGIIFVFISGFAFVGFFLNKFSFNQFMFSPLLVLKMVCSGKYSGLITSFGLVYFIHRFRNLKPGINRDYAKFLAVTGLIIIGSGIFIFYKFPGDWEKRFLDKAQTAKNERAIEDLLDAANAISYRRNKSLALQAVAVAVAKTGDIKWAVSIAQRIPDAEIKDNTMTEIREKIEKKGKGD